MNYQIGTVGEDTSSFVSLCAKFKFKPSPDSSNINPDSNFVVSEDPTCTKRNFMWFVPHQDKGVPIFLGWCCEGLAISIASAFQHLGRYEMHVLGEVLPGIKNYDHHKRNLWHKDLTMMDQSMIDAVSGQALMDKIPTAARHLISNMASNTQQFGIKRADPSQMVNKVSAIDNLRLENQLTELTSLVSQLVVGQHQPPSIAVRVCGICISVEHPTDMCPTLQETQLYYPKSVGAKSGYQYGKWLYQSLQFDNQQFERQQF
ncbi:hypothetical protein CR513_39801, partial [Mucuna pruriens]